MLDHLLLSTERSALQIYHTIAFIQPVRLSWRAFPSVNVDGALLFESRLLIGDRLLIIFAQRHLQPPIFYEFQSLNFSFLLNFCQFFFLLGFDGLVAKIEEFLRLNPNVFPQLYSFEFFSVTMSTTEYFRFFLTNYQILISSLEFT